MNDMKKTFNQIKNETIREFEQGYDNPEEMNSCTDASGQDFHCCGDDCPICSGNNECRCTLSTNTDSSTPCSDQNIESCTIEHIWEMTEHIPPQNISDENGTNNHYIKIIRITKTYHSK